MPLKRPVLWVWRAAGSLPRAGTRSGWITLVTTREYSWSQLYHLFRILCSRMPFILDRIHPNLKSTVYCNAIAYGGVEEWNFAWSMFKSATLASEASKLRGAMACTKKPWLLNKYAPRVLSHTGVHWPCFITFNYIVFCACSNGSRKTAWSGLTNAYLSNICQRYQNRDYRHTSSNRRECVKG